MTISFDCPECGRNYVLKDEFGGKKIKCKGCEAAIRVPNAGVDEDFEDFPEEASGGSAEDDFLQDLNRKSKSRSSSAGSASKKTTKSKKTSGMSGGAKWAVGIGVGVVSVPCHDPQFYKIGGLSAVAGAGWELADVL